jgi:hypothetical protein
MKLSNIELNDNPISTPNHQYYKEKKVLIWELIGILFVTIVGSLFHFVFEWLGNWGPIGGFFPVNESVWEHLKLPFWSLLIFGLIEYNFVKDETSNLIIGKTIASIIGIATILIVFYSYTSIFGIELLVVDILSFILGVVFGQLASYKIITKEKLSNWILYMSWIIIIVLGLIFFLFTYITPHLPIFQDSGTGLYGILDHI